MSFQISVLDDNPLTSRPDFSGDPAAFFFVCFLRASTLCLHRSFLLFSFGLFQRFPPDWHMDAIQSVLRCLSGNTVCGWAATVTAALLHSPPQPHMLPFVPSVMSQWPSQKTVVFRRYSAFCRAARCQSGWAAAHKRTERWSRRQTKHKPRRGGGGGGGRKKKKAASKRKAQTNTIGTWLQGRQDEKTYKKNGRAGTRQTVGYADKQRKCSRQSDKYFGRECRQAVEDSAALPGRGAALLCSTLLCCVVLCCAPT